MIELQQKVVFVSPDMVKQGLTKEHLLAELVADNVSPSAVIDDWETGQGAEPGGRVQVTVSYYDIKGDT